MTYLLCLVPNDWPEPERRIWQAAILPAKFLQRASPASKWSAPRQRIVAQAVGQWLAWLQRNGLMLACEGPDSRLTEQRFLVFVAQLVKRTSPWSAAMMVAAFKRGYDILAPETDYNWLKLICRELKSGARPSRDRFAHLVAPGQIFDLGLRLMERAREVESETYTCKSTVARDGLMLAMLVCFPVRIKNFASIKIGEHLLFHKDRYILKFGSAETKVNKEQVGELPACLTPWIDWYLEVLRPRLTARSKNSPMDWLWINSAGQQLQDSAIRAQIESRTRQEFGLHIWPHLFRAVAATGIVDIAPEAISIASELLGHSSINTTAQHYILARGNIAHLAVQSMILDARAEAFIRLRAFSGGPSQLDP